MSRIDLDHNATTPLGREARAAMIAALDLTGNPSSVHQAGRAARDAVERARAEVARCLGAAPEEVVFTSGGTEGDALAILGLARAARAAGRAAHVVSAKTEHPAVKGAVDALLREGFTASWVDVTPEGRVTPDALAATVRPDTALVTLSAAHHETGNLPDVAALAEVAHAAGALFHTDAVQAAGRVPFRVDRTGVDAATVSAHKLYGPKGAGAVFLRRTAAFEPAVHAGHQERERRAGTENLVAITGFAAAYRATACAIEESAARMATLRDDFERRLLAIPHARVLGDRARRVPGTLLMAFDGAPGDLVVIGLDLEGVAASNGAACTSGSVKPSPGLLAMGLSPERAREAVRFGLGLGTTADEIETAAEIVTRVVARVRARGEGSAR